MGKLSISRMVLAITIPAIFVFPPAESFAAKKIWLERRLEKLFSPPRHKAPKRRKSRPAQQPAARQPGDIRLPDTAPVPEAAPSRGIAAPSPPETGAPLPEQKPTRNAPEASADETPEPRPEEKAASPLDTVPAEPPIPEFRPDKPLPGPEEPETVEPTEASPPPPPPDPRSAMRPDPSGKLPKEEAACRLRLAELDATFETRAAEFDPDGCSMPYPLVVKTLGAGVDLRPEAEMNCAMAEAAARFARDVISPAAERRYGQKLKSISHVSAYVCRTRNGSQKLSEHAFGNALDIASFTLSDGAAISAALHPDAKAAGFLGELRNTACGPFKTVLGPGSDSDHAEHIHLDLAPRRNGGTVCE